MRGRFKRGRRRGRQHAQHRDEQRRHRGDRDGIGLNAGNIMSNSRDIATNTTAIADLDRRLLDVDERVKQVAAMGRRPERRAQCSVRRRQLLPWRWLWQL